MDAHSRRAAALDAIERVRNGALPSELESELLDFKEEGGTVGRDGARRAIARDYEPAAQALAAEAACFANSDAGGVLIVGVDETRRGPEALVGAHLDAAWLRERIHALTQPHLSVDLIEELMIEGKRVYLINVAPGLEEIRCDGKLRARFGRRCEELSGDQARRLLESRRRYDWSGERSGFRLSEAVPAALDLARRFYREEHGRSPSGSLALAQRLGLAADDAEDPQLNNAGALLLCEFERGQIQIDVLATRVEGQPSYARVERPAPLLSAFDDAVHMLNEAFPAERVVVGVQRREIRSIPLRAYREALVNAMMHRDYRQPHGRVVVTITGAPAATLKVRSPGGFPQGVTADHLLSTPSRPRNPVLAQALHTLGLAEREGIGVDAMYLEMLRDGHAAPEIVEDGGDVLCTLRGGGPDAQVRAFFDQLAEEDEVLGDDVRAYIAITQLLEVSALRPERLAGAAQCTRAEAVETLERLERAGTVERLLDRSLSFRLGKAARERLRSRITYAPRAPLEARWEMIQAYLDQHAEIGREEVAELLGVTGVQASRTLSELCKRGVLEWVGQRRGRGVRYRRST